MGSELKTHLTGNLLRIANRIPPPSGRCNPPNGPKRAGNGKITFPQQKNAHKAIPLFHIRGKICSISTVSGSKVILSRASEVTPLIKQDIVHHVIERTGLPRTKAEAAVDTVFEGLKQALASGERIELRGFGVFSVRARKTGIGRNPRTGTEVSIAPGKAVRFKPGKELHAIEPGAESKG